MVREHGGDGEIVVPPTIHALLQARIDSLDGDVRVVMERGSVEGEVFHRGAVAELSPAPVRADVESHLTTLVRKELIRSTAPTFPEDEGFRFRHLLIRDAAYESLPKATRAELHEQFADWLSTHDLVEGDEIVGYHLEQAHRYRIGARSGATRPSRRSPRVRADHLASSGSRRARPRRLTTPAARSLRRRAVAIAPPSDERRHALAPDLCIALFESGELDEAGSRSAEARTSSDAASRGRAALVTHGRPGHRRHGRDQDARSEHGASEAREVFEERGRRRARRLLVERLRSTPGCAADDGDGAALRARARASRACGTVRRRPTTVDSG